VDFSSLIQIANYKVGVIKRCIRESIKDPEFVKLVRRIFTNVPRQQVVDYLWMYMSKFGFVQEINTDYCKHAMEFYQDKSGDCEDFVVFEASALILMGYKPIIKVYDTEGLGYYKHVVLEVFSPKAKKIITFDGTYRVEGLGGKPPIVGNKIRRYRI
jgi:hypothetical protein